MTFRSIINMNQYSSNPQRSPYLWIPVLVSLAFVVGIVLGLRLQVASPSIELVKGDLVPNAIGNGKVEELIRYIEAKYVDEVDRDILMDEAINEVLQQLDPHSSYLNAEQVRDVREQLEGNFDGIGVEFMILDDTIVVIAPLAGGPSEAVGVMAGDRIVMIEDSLVAGVGIESPGIMKMLRGQKGEEVQVGILRPGEKELRDFTITRDKIPVHSVDVAYMLNEKTGYIKVNRFSATTYQEFMKGVEELVENQGMEDLVVDLRQNPGGYLREATEMLSQLFQDREKLLVYTEGRTSNRQEYKSTGRPFFRVGQVVVLIDEGSASASEIMAGALQDHDRALIVGRRSFGKGLVQEQYPLSDGSAIRLTVARYYTPSGRSIQKDYNDRSEYRKEMVNRFSTGELISEDSIPQLDSVVYYTSSGRPVYGGGGIRPDVFVPLDTQYMNETYLSMRAYLPQFILRNMEQFNSLGEGQALTQFQESYQPRWEDIEAWAAYTEDKGIQVDPAELTALKSKLMVAYKARVAKQLYGDEGYFSILNSEDPDIITALELIREKQPITSN
ncbi:MAG: S41 family peptidase [Bacteroidota bacterium]